MRTIGSWVTSPDEFKRFGIDYSDWLNGSERIVAASCSVSPRTSPIFDVSGIVISGNGAGVVFFGGRGEAGTDYTVTITVTTNIGQQKQDRVLFKVRDG